MVDTDSFWCLLLRAAMNIIVLGRAQAVGRPAAIHRTRHIIFFSVCQVQPVDGVAACCTKEPSRVMFLRPLLHVQPAIAIAVLFVLMITDIQRSVS